MDDKRLARRPDDGMIAGVAAGIAHRFDIDVTLVRLAFVALAIVSAGTAIVLYLVAAVVMPRADDEPGVDSVKHGVDDLITRGRELYGETRKVIDRSATRKQDGTIETPADEPATVSSTSSGNNTNP
jgi:phage shock protein C